MLIIDGHLDLALNAIQLNRDLTLSVYTLRTQEAGLPREWGYGQGTVALPEMRRGRVALCFSTLLARSTGRPRPLLDYPSPTQAYAVAQGHLGYYRALASAGQIRLIKTLADLEQHIGSWHEWESQPDDRHPPIGLMISMESADPVLSPNQLSEWWSDGVRLIGPAHYGPGRYVGGTGTELGFNESGLALLREMARLGVALDVTHLCDQAFWQAIDQFDGIVVASHNNTRAIVPHQRQFDDAQIRALIQRDSVIGAAFDNWMIRPGWKRGEPLPVTIAHVVEHIDYICQLAGSSAHAAIGSDLDGGFGQEQAPNDLDTIADVQRVADILSSRGYSDEDIAGIMHGNWLRVLRRIFSNSSS